MFVLLFLPMLVLSLAASDVSAIDDLDELEVYGTIEVQNQGTQITAYTFEVGNCRNHQDARA